MRKLAIGVIVAVAVVAVATGVALRSTITAAAELGSQTESVDAADRPTSIRHDASSEEAAAPAGEGEEEDKDRQGVAYLGIAVETLSEAEAGERSIEGGALVRRVAHQGPAGEALRPGDVILSIGERQVLSAQDVVDIVGDAAPGEVLRFEVLREDGEIETVEITAGAHERVVKRAHRFEFDREGGPSLDAFVRGEFVVKHGEGFVTIAAAYGELDAVDPDIVVSPADGSDPVVVQVPEEDAGTLIVLSNGRKAEPGDLDLDGKALVVTVKGPGEDDERTLVVQGEGMAHFAGVTRFLLPYLDGIGPRPGLRPFAGPGGRGQLRRGVPRLGAGPELQEHLRGLVGELGRDIAPRVFSELQKRLKQLPSDGRPFGPRVEREFNLVCEDKEAEEESGRFTMRCKFGE